MNNPVLDSLLFLSVARGTLCEYYDTLGIDNMNEVRRFLKDEATDYQIMELIVSGNLSENRYDDIREQRLWVALKQAIYMENVELLEVIGENLSDRFLSKMGPVVEYGLSSRRPILELHVKSGVLAEASFWDDLKGWSKEKLSQGVDKVKDLSAKARGKAARHKEVDTAKQKGTTPPKPEEKTTPKKADAKKEPVKTTPPKPEEKTTPKKTEEKPKAAPKKTEEKPKAAPKKTEEPKNTPLFKGVTDRWNKLTPNQKGAAKGAAAVGGAALIAWAAKKAYDKHFSKAAQACKYEDDPSSCRAKYRMNARNAKLTSLKAGLSKCRDERCRGTIQGQISRLAGKRI